MMGVLLRSPCDVQIPEITYYGDIGLEKIPFVLHYENLSDLRDKNRLKLKSSSR